MAPKNSEKLASRLEAISSIPSETGRCDFKFALLLSHYKADHAAGGNGDDEDISTLAGCELSDSELDEEIRLGLESLIFKSNPDSLTSDNLQKLNSLSVTEAHDSIDAVDSLWECTSEGTSYTDASAFSDTTGACESQPPLDGFQGCSDQNSAENPAQLEGSDKERFAGWDRDLKERRSYYHESTALFLIPSGSWEAPQNIPTTAHGKNDSQAGSAPETTRGRGLEKSYGFKKRARESGGSAEELENAARENSEVEPGLVPSLRTSSTKRKRGRPSSKKRHAVYRAKMAAKGDTAAKRHEKKLKEKTEVYKASVYSVLRKGLFSKPGWMGCEPNKISKEELRKAYVSGEIKQLLVRFALAPCYDIGRPLVLLDCEGLIFFVRTNRPAFFLEGKDPLGPALVEENLKLVGKLGPKPGQRTKAEELRGDHAPVVLGIHRQKQAKPVKAKFETENPQKSKDFKNSRSLKRLVGWIDAMVWYYFPNVAQRYQDCAERKPGGHKPPFGLFWNYCLNAMYEGQDRVNCLPHSDSKNVVGVCVVLVYELPGANFNHTQRSWLVIWDAGIIVEMPPWTAAIYPSSLFYHFNIDIHDIKFVVTDGERPTRENAREVQDGDESGRGSIVFFSQASMFQTAETGYDSLNKAHKVGLNTDKDILKDTLAYFDNSKDFQ
ncbi:hypothetical protein BDN72DRAFT_902511 [Pluteus cervinus]|uniref:Uncharacterized protein n=1 Tax=Pluteus cervinus TaxID=181527 RepID=A0ACD3AD01_9AGAR|nr:hypothetical protein BDN72DRAFT_902511 [Pluteus cervinus]